MIDPTLSAQFLRSYAPTGPWPADVPTREWTRSPAAARVGQLAARDGLHLFHFEHRAHLPIPANWMPPGSESLAAPPAWDRGVLPERKYHSFRHDLPLGSYHPHHRAKWSSHELCHALVGFAWDPDATPFFHATAGRLAELLPVALWYFFDEAFLNRCPDHQHGGALFRTFCAKCEEVAAIRRDDPMAEERIAAGLRFIDRELLAVDRSIEAGRPVSHRWATIDLASDGVAYAASHGHRLTSPRFRGFAEAFYLEGGPLHLELESLIERVHVVSRAILLGEPLRPFTSSPAHGRARWMLQDLGWRLATVAELTPGDGGLAVDDLVRQVATLVPATAQEADPSFLVQAGLQAVHAAYTELYDQVALPHPDDVFGLGYRLPLPQVQSPAQLLEGVLSANPIAGELMGDSLQPVVNRFMSQEVWSRTDLPTRWKRFIRSTHGPHVADLADWEAAVATLPPQPEAALMALEDADAVRLATHVRLVNAQTDVIALAERLDEGSVDLSVDDETITMVVHDEPLDDEPTLLLLSRGQDGEPVLLDLPTELQAALGEEELQLDEDDYFALADADALVPSAMPLYWA